MNKKERFNDIERKLNVLWGQEYGKDIRELQRQVGYDRSFFYRAPLYTAPKLTISEKLDLILDHLGLKIEKQEEKYLLVKKKKSDLPHRVVYKKRGLKMKIKPKERL